MEMQDVLTTVHGKPITVEDVFVFLKASGHFRNAIYGVIELEVIKRKAQALGISVSAEEVREHSEQKKRWMGLRDAEEWQRHCRWLGINAETWERMVRTELLRRKLQSRAIGPADIKKYFASHKSRLATLQLSRVVCSSEAEAARLAAQLKARPDDFPAVARGHSIEEQTRNSGGYLGRVNRGLLPPHVERALFAARPSEVVGPFLENEHWTVYRVEGFDSAELDDTQRAYITERLFADWLRQEVEVASA